MLSKIIRMQPNYCYLQLWPVILVQVPNQIRPVIVNRVCLFITGTNR